MNLRCKVFLLVVALSIVSKCEGQGVMAKEYFRYFEKVSMWARTVFRTKYSTVEDCALQCLDMDGKCKAFVFSRITGNCYGLPVDLKAGGRHARRSQHYDLYCTISQKVIPYWNAKKNGGPLPRIPEKIARVFPVVSRRIVTSPPERTTTAATTTTPAATATTECIKEAPMILYMASSYYTYYTPDNAEPKAGTGWLASMNDNSQYLELDIRELKDVASITTYGATYQNKAQFVTSYKLQFLSKAMGEYETYQENETDKIFSGNTDSDTPSTHQFQKGGIKALKIRIVPVTYYNNIMLRASADVYC